MHVCNPQNVININHEVSWDESEHNAASPRATVEEVLDGYRPPPGEEGVGGKLVEVRGGRVWIRCQFNFSDVNSSSSLA